MKNYTCIANEIWTVVDKKRKRLISWGSTDNQMATAAYNILVDAFDGDTSKATRLYVRFKRRMIDSGVWTIGSDRGWTISLNEITVAVKVFEENDKLIARERSRVEPPPMMSDRGQGVVWDSERPDRK